MFCSRPCGASIRRLCASASLAALHFIAPYTRVEVDIPLGHFSIARERDRRLPQFAFKIIKHHQTSQHHENKTDEQLPHAVTSSKNKEKEHTSSIFQNSSIDKNFFSWMQDHTHHQTSTIS